MREAFRVKLSHHILHSLQYIECCTYLFYQCLFVRITRFATMAECSHYVDGELPNSTATLPSDTEHMLNKRTSEPKCKDTVVRGDGERYDIDGAQL